MFSLTRTPHHVIFVIFVVSNLTLNHKPLRHSPLLLFCIFPHLMCRPMCNVCSQSMYFSSEWTSTVYLHIKWGYLLSSSAQKAHSKTLGLPLPSLCIDCLYHRHVPCYSNKMMMFWWRFSCWSHLISAQLISCVYWNSNSRPLLHSTVQELRGFWQTSFHFPHICEFL